MRSNWSAEPPPREIADALDASRERLVGLGRRLIYFTTIESTNTVAAALAAESANIGLVVLAEAQTAGRGRLGRPWFSPPASGLYVSVILAAPDHARGDARATRLLTLAAGVALAESIETATGLPIVIKWPNDIYVARRKLAGILAEAIAPIGPPGSGPASGAQRIVLGYGINVGRMAFPPELADRATSLEIELGRPVDRARMFVETLEALARRYDDLVAGRFDAILDSCRARAPASRGARISWTTPAGVRSGITAGIDDDGALLVRVGEQLERIVAGEIAWL